MLDFLIEQDQTFYEFLNGKLTNAFLDWFMPVITNKKTWIPLYVAILAFLIYHFRTRSWIPIIALVAAVGLSDTISSKILKPGVWRVRPCNEASVQSRILVSCHNTPSFPSSHATNHFAIATFLAGLLRKRFKSMSWAFFLWATLIAYSRIYVGVHYPMDVIGGAIIGTMIGTLFLSIARKLLHRFAEK